MSMGDPRYQILMAGSTPTGASGLHNLFGAYSGLSLVNNDETVYLQIAASVNEFMIGPSANNAGIPAGLISNDIGYKIYPGLSWISLPPLRAGTASLMQFVRPSGDSASYNNASAHWVILTRPPVY